MAVRLALISLFTQLMRSPMGPEARDTAQIVLAEVLNNIVEHAYGETPGEIEVTIDVSSVGLSFRIIDAGLPLPDGALPLGDLPVGGAPVLCPDGEMPEGGFGWYLIRTLSEDVAYRREGERNFLTFRISAQQCAH